MECNLSLPTASLELRPTMQEIDPIFGNFPKAGEEEKIGLPRIKGRQHRLCSCNIQRSAKVLVRGLVKFVPAC